MDFEYLQKYFCPILCVVLCLICVIYIVKRDSRRCYPMRYYREGFSAIDGNYTNGFIVPEVRAETFKYKNKDFEEYLGEYYSLKVEEILSSAYPIGSLFITIDKSFDPNDKIPGTWEKVSGGYYLRTNDGNDNVGKQGGDNYPYVQEGQETSRSFRGYVAIKKDHYNVFYTPKYIDAIVWKRIS